MGISARIDNQPRTPFEVGLVYVYMHTYTRTYECTYTGMYVENVFFSAWN